jgi:LmbE family N-acetylglucosaminyl deacetylase
MDRIVAIGSSLSPLDFQLGCLGTLSKYVNKGSELSVIIATERKQGADHNNEQQHQTQKDSTVTMIERTATVEGQIEKSCKAIGASQILFAEQFDHSVVSQANVDVLRSLTEAINPSVALIPFYKSSGPITRVVGRSALLACRWVQNVLMYDIDTGAKSAFQPGIFSVLSPEQFESKKSIISNFNDVGKLELSPDEDQKRVKFLQASQSANVLQDKGPVEAFQSHRLLLLSSSANKENNYRGSLFQ